MTLGDKIQQLRKAAGLSQEQLANMLDVSRQAISKWETDQSLPEIEKILALSKAFSISTDELLGNNIALSAEDSNLQLEDISRMNIKKRQFTIGWITMLLGLVMLICDFVLLKMLQYNDLKNLGQFYDDAHLLEYVGQQPMATVFAITIIIIFIGVCLTILSLVHKPKNI